SRFSPDAFRKRCTRPRAVPSRGSSGDNISIATIAGLALLLPLASALGCPVLPLTLRALFVFLWIAAIVRPHAALLALTILVPLGATLVAIGGGPPLPYTETLVLAAISGSLIAASRPRLTPLVAQPPSLIAPAIVVCAAAV